MPSLPSQVVLPPQQDSEKGGGGILNCLNGSLFIFLAMPLLQHDSRREREAFKCLPFPSPAATQLDMGRERHF